MLNIYNQEKVFLLNKVTDKCLDHLPTDGYIFIMSGISNVEFEKLNNNIYYLANSYDMIYLRSLEKEYKLNKLANFINRSYYSAQITFSNQSKLLITNAIPNKNITKFEELNDYKLLFNTDLGYLEIYNGRFGLMATNFDLGKNEVIIQNNNINLFSNDIILQEINKNGIGETIHI